MHRNVPISKAWYNLHFVVGWDPNKVQYTISQVCTYDVKIRKEFISKKSICLNVRERERGEREREKERERERERKRKEKEQ